MIRLPFLLLQVALLVSLGVTHVFSQVPRPAPQRVVGNVEIEFIDVQNVAQEVVRVNIQTREGAVFDEAVIDSDIRSLYRTGLFEYIEVKRDFTPDNRVNLVFSVRPQYRVQSVQFEGNERATDRRLQRETTIRQNAALDERVVRLDAEALHTYYQRRGYSQAVVSYDIERNPRTGTGVVRFLIEEGERVRIGRVNFSGNQTISDRRLRKVMETRRWHLFSWLTGRGRFKDDVFEDDLEKLRDHYREEGFLDVEVMEDQVLIDYPYPDQMEITIRIREGRQYRTGQIAMQGNLLYSEEHLRGVLRLRSGDVFVPSQLDADVERLRDAYGQDGYLDTQVRVNRRPNVETGNIDLNYQITEGTKHFVESIQIEGNTKTKSVVIIRELGLGPGDVFNTVRMKSSQRRLQNTRFFEEVALTPAVTDIPGRRDLRINVREGRTGSVTFGAGFSSLERAIIFAEYSEANFDLFNYRSRFQGAGQKFRFRVQIGSRSNELLLSFEEPWLFQRELAFGFQIFRSETRYLATTYNELRTGFEVYFRKRLIELIEGRLSYRFEVVDIFDVRATAPTVIQDERGERTVSKVGFSLLRDTRDSLLLTTRGNRIELLTELAGGPFAGQTDYYRLEARGSQFFPLFEAQTQVLSLIGRMGTVVPHSGAERVPFFDRYFLGGPYTLRGFAFRDVGPMEPEGDPLGERVGGNSYGFFSAEYSLTVIEPVVRFAVFYDAGFVNSGDYNFSLSDYNDNYGIGLRILVMGAPLRLDYGIPITTDEFNDRGGRFSFSFGTRF
jgi:outer membrane protein insertion porin family